MPSSDSDFGVDFGPSWGTESNLRLIINGYQISRDGSIQYWYRYPDGVPGPEPPSERS